jgi:deleted-in-malignant-brain-tumors protein 1
MHYLLYIIAGNFFSANCSDGDVRLVDGSADYEGRVEVCINRVWGTVCSTAYRYYSTYYQRWDLSDAKVVCRQLGHQELGATVYTSSSTFGAGTDPVFLSDLQCVGSEANLLECRHSNFVQLGSNRYCTHSRDVGLRCERKIHAYKIITKILNLPIFSCI